MDPLFWNSNTPYSDVTGSMRSGAATAVFVCVWLPVLVVPFPMGFTEVVRNGNILFAYGEKLFAQLGRDPVSKHQIQL